MKSNATSCLLGLLMAVMPLEGQAGSLSIVIVEGEGVIHNLRQPVAQELTVRVEDGNKKPVAGATVAFVLPADGPGATFANHTAQATAMTDAQGMVVVHGLRPNSVAGKLEIRVVASYQGQTARATVTQFNMLARNASRKSASKAILILSLVGAAAAGGAYAGLHKNGSTPAAAAPAPASIGIAPGTGAVGTPQ